MNLDTLEIVLISLLVTFFGSIVAVFRSKEWLKGLTNYFLRRLDDREILEIRDLERHRLLIKLNFYKHSEEYKSGVTFSSQAKAEVFTRYINIIATCYYDFVLEILKQVTNEVAEDDLVFLLSKETIKLNTKINESIRASLLAYGGDTREINKVVIKLHDWRSYYTSTLYRHSEEIIRSGKYTGTLYKIDTIFSNYALGMDILFKNGIDSFNLLNGELDNLIIKK